MELDRAILDPRGSKLGGLDGETIAALERLEMPLCLALASFQAGGFKVCRCVPLGSWAICPSPWILFIIKH